MVHLRKDYSRFQDAGADVAVVTMGSVEQSAEFWLKHRLPFRCLADPDLTAYQAFQLQRGGIAQIAGPAVWLSGLKSFLRHGTAKPVGRIRQLHGAFVIDTGGILQYVHYPINSFDNPSHDEIVTVLETLPTTAK